MVNRTWRIATTLTASLAMFIFSACAAPPPEPAPPTPELFRPDGVLVVTNPRSTEGVDFCSLLSADDLEGILPRPIESNPVKEYGCVYFSNGLITITVDMNPVGIPYDNPPVGVAQNSAPTQLIAGNAGGSGPLDNEGCQVDVALDSRPAASNITLGSSDVANCAQLLALAEIVVDRLPRPAP